MSILDRFKLTGKVALITGGSRGIGAAIAKAYVEAGAELVLAARDEVPLEKTAAQLRKLGVKVLTVQTDVMQEEQLESLVETALQSMGRIDVLVNNAVAASDRIQYASAQPGLIYGYTRASAHLPGVFSDAK